MMYIEFNCRPNFDAFNFNNIILSLLFPHKSESPLDDYCDKHVRCAGCVSLLLNHLCFPPTDVAIHDDRAIREQPRHPILCKTLWCNSMRLQTGYTEAHNDSEVNLGLWISEHDCKDITPSFILRCISMCVSRP